MHWHGVATFLAESDVRGIISIRFLLQLLSLLLVTVTCLAPMQSVAADDDDGLLLLTVPMLQSPSLTGQWSVSFQLDGQEGNITEAWAVTQTGSALSICTPDRRISGSRSGQAVAITMPVVGDTLSLNGTAARDTMGGLFAGSSLSGAWAGARTSPTPVCTLFDYPAQPLPRFVTASHLDPSKMAWISRFRSGYGHDYSDEFESCRSMKHYYEPKDQGIIGPWSGLAAFSPVNGTVVAMEDEQLPNSGRQIRIQSAEQPAFRFVLFHVAPEQGLSVGSVVAAGQQIGTHGRDDGNSDIAVEVATPQGGRLVSFFDVMTDGLFAVYQALGVTDREAMIISAAERDADPLGCNGETFQSNGTLPNFVFLNQ